MSFTHSSYWLSNQIHPFMSRGEKNLSSFTCFRWHHNKKMRLWLTRPTISAPHISPHVWNPGSLNPQHVLVSFMGHAKTVTSEVEFLMPNKLRRYKHGVSESPKTDYSKCGPVTSCKCCIWVILHTKMACWCVWRFTTYWNTWAAITHTHQKKNYQ